MRPKLLLADDSVTIQRVIELTFADEDVQVVAVGDGQQAIDRVRLDHPDIVLADVGMPELDGYEVSAFIKGDPALAHIPVLLLTGAFEPIDEAQGACGRMRRRPRQAVRAADGDQPRARPARRQARGRCGREVLARRGGARAGRRALRDRSKTTSTGSTRPWPARVRRRPHSTRCLSTKPATPRPTLTVVPSAVAARPSPHADLDLTGWNPSASVEPAEKPAPVAPVEHRQPAAPPVVQPGPRGILAAD